MQQLLTASALIALAGHHRHRPIWPYQRQAEPRSLRDVATDLLLASRRPGIDLAVLAGGEATLHPDLQRIVTATSKVGLELGLVSDGRNLDDEELWALLQSHNLRYLRLPLHGGNAKTHDTLLQVPGAFDQVAVGLERLLARGPSTLTVDVACTLTRGTLESFEELIRWLRPLKKRAKLTLRLVARAFDADDAPWPDGLDDPKPINRILHLANEAFAEEHRAAWEGLPPCFVAEELAHLRDETLRYGVPVFGPSELVDALPRESQGDRSHPLPCQECRHRATCPGAPQPFLVTVGPSRLRPARALRANSFNYERRERLPGFHLQAPRSNCSARDLDFQGRPLRSLLLRQGEEVTLCQTTTSDFTDDELRQVKDIDEQLYLDLSREATLTDFLQSVRRTRLHDVCRRCRDRGDCASLYEPIEAPPFAEEEQLIRERLQSVRGRVLDVGCGEGAYREVLDELLDNGLIEYHGLDPDERSLERLRQEKSGLSLHRATIEAFTWQEDGFDALLLLRSFNHIHDLDRAFTNIVELLEPEGRLLLCDSPPFAMIRSLRQVDFADEHARYGHEHYRNWTSYQVLELLERYPLRTVLHRPVSSKSSNQWVLELEKRRR